MASSKPRRREARTRASTGTPKPAHGRGGLIEDSECELLRTGSGGIYSTCNLLLLHGRGAPTRDVFCSAIYCGKVMAESTIPVAQNGVIANDGGLAKDNSDISGPPTLAEAGIPAAAVAGMSARIGHPRSTYCDGVI